jgi:hypothetical protein
MGTGWYGLIGILQANAQDREQEFRRPPLACPNDGEPLVNSVAASSDLFCHFDGWMYPRDWLPPLR